MPTTVKLDSTGRHPLDGIVDAFREAGATHIIVDTRTGDGGQTSDWFYISFQDPGAPDEMLRTRVCEGSRLVPCPESPLGFTRVTLGSDEFGRGAHFVKAVAARYGGRVDDFRTESVDRFIYPPEIVEELEAPAFFR